MVIARQSGVLQSNDGKALLPSLRSVAPVSNPEYTRISNWSQMSRWQPQYGRTYSNHEVSSLCKPRPVRRVRFELPSTADVIKYSISDDESAVGDSSFSGGGYWRGSAGSGGDKGSAPTSQRQRTSRPVQTQPRSKRFLIHTTGKYVRGTLPPTATVAPPPPLPSRGSVGSGANWGGRSGGGEATSANSTVGLLLRAARDNDEVVLRDVLRRAVLVGLSENELNGSDCSGRTPISYISGNGSVAVLEALLQVQGVNVNIPDNEGNTPLHYAAQAGQIECVNMLLNKGRGLEIDARNSLGFTALMKAALQGRTKCAKLLLFAGASPTLKDCGRGLRAEQWARFCGRYSCAEAIEKFARHRLLERSTSCGRWGSEPDIGAKLLSTGRLPAPPPQPQPGGLKSKFRKVFRTSSGPNASEQASSARLVTQLTTAALCASTPVLPSGSSTPGVVKSLIRPLQVPKVQVTLVNNGEVLHNLNPVVTRTPTTEHDKIATKPPTKTKKKK